MEHTLQIDSHNIGMYKENIDISTSKSHEFKRRRANPQIDFKNQMYVEQVQSIENQGMIDN